MFGLVVADVKIAIIFRDQVHIMEDEAVPVVVFQGLQVADIQQLCTIKCCITSLSEQKMEGNIFGLQYNRLFRRSFILNNVCAGEALPVG